MSKTVLIAAGGTGGHIFPGLAAAAELQQLGARVVWLGSRDGMEATLVPQRGLKIHLIDIGGLRGKSVVSLLWAPFRLMHALWQTRRVFNSERPDCVLGMGGFAAGPGGITAFLSRIPLVIHEQNAIPGVTNRTLARLATHILEAFRGSFAGTGKVTAVGNPVRRELSAVLAPEQRDLAKCKPLRILVLGGSRGAQALNETLPAAIALVPVAQRPQILHQAGKTKQSACLLAYQQAGVAANVVEFIEDMKAAYEQTDLVVARSGALTLAELAAVGLGSVLVPYPHAADDHQMANARYFESAGAALVVAQQDLSPARLADILVNLSEDTGRLRQMASSARSLALPDAALEVAQCCIEVCKG
jgi:UDP-N-acetylglucosamine--N-acetylmuramyl-(pentapeptide) pyrophosphoryl-undecaprenol N-acetylglucosamine transferase